MLSKRKQLILGFAAGCLLVFGLSAGVAHAQKVNYEISNVAKFAGLAPASGQVDTLPQMIGNVVGVLLSLVSTLFFVLILYAGFMWMTSRGNEDQERKSRMVLFGAIVGMIIVMSAYGVTRFVFQSLGGATQSASSPSAPTAKVDTCSQHYTDFTCTHKFRCGLTPQFYAVRHGQIGQGKFESGNKYLSGLCLSDPNPDIVCCKMDQEFEEITTACLVPQGKGSGKYDCFEQDSISCSQDKGQFFPNLSACKDTLKKIADENDFCVYKEEGTFFCHRMYKTLCTLIDGQVYDNEAKCKSVAEQANNNKDIWCLTKEGKCSQMKGSACDAIKGDSISSEANCKGLAEVRCGSKYGSVGMLCVSGSSACSTDSADTNIVSGVHKQLGFGLINGSHITNVCSGSQVCCFPKEEPKDVSVDCLYQRPDGAYSCFVSTSEQKCKKDWKGEVFKDKTACESAMGKKTIYCVNKFETNQKCEQISQEDCQKKSGYSVETKSYCDAL